MSDKYKQTFKTELKRLMAVTASIFLSPIFKCVIEVIFFGTNIN